MPRLPLSEAEDGGDRHAGVRARLQHRLPGLADPAGGEEVREEPGAGEREHEERAQAAGGEEAGEGGDDGGRGEAHRPRGRGGRGARGRGAVRQKKGCRGEQSVGELAVASGGCGEFGFDEGRVSDEVFLVTFQ